MPAHKEKDFSEIGVNPIFLMHGLLALMEKEHLNEKEALRIAVKDLFDRDEELLLASLGHAYRFLLGPRKRTGSGKHN